MLLFSFERANGSLKRFSGPTILGPICEERITKNEIFVSRLRSSFFGKNFLTKIFGPVAQLVRARA